MPLLVESTADYSRPRSGLRPLATKRQHVVKVRGNAGHADVVVHVIFGEPGAGRLERAARRTAPAHPFDAFGPFLSVEAAARRTGDTVDSVAARVTRRELLGARTADGVLVLPEWQFSETGEPWPRLEEVLQCLAAGTEDAWTWMQWLTGASEVGSSPAWQALAAGGAVADAVAEEARRDGLRWSR